MQCYSRKKSAKDGFEYIKVNICSKTLVKYCCFILCSLFLSLFCRQFIKDKGLGGKISTQQVKRKWENLTAKYKVRFCASTSKIMLNVLGLHNFKISCFLVMFHRTCASPSRGLALRTGRPQRRHGSGTVRWTVFLDRNHPSHPR